MKTALRFTWIFLCTMLTFLSCCWNGRDVLVERKIYFVDGDCYARMTRARMISEHPGTIVRHHDFENWPEGVTSHTTAPLDYLIVGLKWTLDGIFAVLDPKHANFLHEQTLDLAGALISPLLGCAGTLFLGWWLAKFRVRFGSAALLFYAVCPILVHGYLLGRPDHQSLLMLTITVAFGAELALARKMETDDAKSRRRWGIVSGIAWGVSLWVSLYEPTILLVVTIGLWVAFDRRALFTRERLPGAMVCAGIVLVSLLLEGWPVAIPDAAMRAYFANWEHTIGELTRLTPAQLFVWVGWWAVVSPILLLLSWREDRRALPLLIVLLVVAGLTLWQARWGYFLGIAFAWTLPWQMQALRRTWAAWLFFIVGWWPILGDWDARLFPDEEAQRKREVKHAEQVTLRQISEAAIGQRGGAFLASWWLSPSIAYWSRQPGVAGTSHESLPGIVDTARFFVSTDPKEAGAILKKRKVRWVLADDASHEIDTSNTLLGTSPPPGESMAVALAEHPEDAPEFLTEWQARATVRVDRLQFYRLYGVDDVMLPP